MSNLILGLHPMTLASVFIALFFMMVAWFINLTKKAQDIKKGGVKK